MPRRLAQFLDFSTPHLFAHLQYHPNQKVPLYLHNKGSIANAFVTTARFRSEFWHNPISSIHNPWFETLILHEGRHIAHLYHASKKGFWKYLFWYPLNNNNNVTLGASGLFGDSQRNIFIALIPRVVLGRRSGFMGNDL